MASTNGTMGNGDLITLSPSHLGKRKRSSSPRNLTPEEGTEKLTSLQPKLQNVLQIARKFDSTPSLLRYPLSVRTLTKPHSKRTRLSSPRQANENAESIDNIENRILLGMYASFEALLEDVESAKIGMLENLNSTTPNTNTKVHTNGQADLKDQISKLVNVLCAHEDGSRSRIKKEGAETSEIEKSPTIPPEIGSGQILCLRSQTDRGAQQLFSGLQLPRLSQGHEGKEIDGRKLPNGFELTNPPTISTNLLDQTSDRRLFGDVFRAHRGLKPLELPQPSRNLIRGNKLHFIPDSSLDAASFPNRQDYRLAPLPTGSWLHYSSVADTEAGRKGRQKDLSSNSSDRVPTLGRAYPDSEEQARNMFAEAYSTFAPSFDNSKAVFSVNDLSRQWWHKRGQNALSSVLGSSFPEDQKFGNVTIHTDSTNDDFNNLVANFIPEEQSAPTEQSEDVQSLDDVLEQISELLESLNSYQSIRNFEWQKTADGSKPSSVEIDTYELLVSQLSILIASLPPFAVSKLNGDQLRALNIKTQVQVDTPDYQGTAQADDYTLRRIKAAQTATLAAGRTAPMSHVRPNYQNPAANPTIYHPNNQNRVAYNANTNLGAGYTPRPVNYQPPRPSATPQRPFTQTSYQQTGNSYGAQSTAQQFQRPIPNGYPSYASTPSQNNLIQRPSQPGYQQRAQDNAITYGQPSSPSKPMVNGQNPSNYTQQQQQQSVPQIYGSTPSNAITDQRAMMELVKTQNNAQNSTSPGPRPSSSTGSRYEGAPDQRDPPRIGTGQGQMPTVEALR